MRTYLNLYFPQLPGEAIANKKKQRRNGKAVKGKTESMKSSGKIKKKNKKKGKMGKKFQANFARIPLMPSKTSSMSFVPSRVIRMPVSL